MTPEINHPPPQSTFRALAIQAAGMLGLLTLITGVVYPLAVTAAAKVAFPEQANGTLIVNKEEILGSELIGQPFEDPKHFWGRLSATAPFAYNAGASTGSNLGPTNEALTKNAKARLDALREADPGLTAPVPVDLVTASGSGLDPHISPAAAAYQIPRVARARGIPDDILQTMVAKHTDGRTFGLLGEPRVNVLLLNLELDKRK